MVNLVLSKSQISYLELGNFFIIDANEDIIRMHHLKLHFVMYILDMDMDIGDKLHLW